MEFNILCPTYINGKKYDKEYYRFLIKILGIEKLIRKRPFESSGEDQQRIAIARAMLLKPKIVFADEPTGNLDTENTKVITNLFQRLHRECNTTFIIVTHEENTGIALSFPAYSHISLQNIPSNIIRCLIEKF